MNGATLIDATLPALIGFCVALVALPLARGWAAWPGLVDPVERDHSGRAMPRTGGVAIALGWGGACAAVAWTELWPLLVFALLALGLGLHDDRVRSSPRLRLGVLAILSVGVTLAGLRVDALYVPGSDPIALGWLAIPLSAAWVLGTTVAFDLVDGLDGLAGALAVIAGIGLMATGSGAGALAAGGLAGATGAFLLFNRPRASVYMGDNGSNLVGFVVGASTLAAMGGEGGFRPLVAALFIAVPLLDTVTATLRRLRRGDLFRADLEHLHHRLAARLSPWKALGVLSTVAVGCATVGWLLTRVDAAPVLLPLAAAGLGWLLWEARVRR